MLARGVLCRLAADVPKTSTHDLPQLAHLHQRNILSRNGISLPSICALSRAYKTALLKYRRTYATTTRATKPTAKVKTDVKKAAAKKTTKRAAKKKTTKSAAKKKPKRKTTAKKAKPKKKTAGRTKRALTNEEKEKQTIREYKKKALKEPVKPKALTAWQVFVAEAATGASSVADIRQRFAGAAVRFKELTPAEKEHYNHLANERTAAKRAEYDAWIRSHTPEQIRIANQARTYLRRKLKGSRKGPPAYTQRLRDDRLVKRPAPAYTLFCADRRTSGDFKGISGREATKLCADEWKSLSAGEKKKYEDAFAADKARYQREFQSTYGHAPSS